MIRALALSTLLIAGSAQAQLAAEIGVTNNPGAPRGGAPAICSDPAIIAIDDGVAENGYSGNAASVAEATFVQRFDAADFPGGSIDTVCIGWVSLGPSAINFEIVVFDDDGAAGAPGTELGSIAESASGIPTGLPETVFAFDLSAAGIALPATGNFYLGVRFTPLNPNFFIAADETGATNAGAGQLFFDTGDPGTDAWQAINAAFPNYSALIVRALPGTAGAPPPETQPVPSLSNLGLILLSLMLAGLALVAIRVR